MSKMIVVLVATGIAICTSSIGAQPNLESNVGIVSHVKVVSDKVPDVSSMEAWKASFIKDDMKPADKAMAAWKSVVMFGLEGAQISEAMGGGDDCVHDVIKTFNVYGCNYCDCSGGMVACLARYLGMEARGWTLHGHCLSEVFYDDGWHMLDAAYVNYFPKRDGSLASIAEIRAAAKEWFDENPGYLGDGNKLAVFAREGGWKKGPALLASFPQTADDGSFPCEYGSWAKTMVNYDGGQKTPSPYEAGYHQGYQVNIQLRKGERLTRNWSNQGKALPIPKGLPDEILNAKTGQGILKHTPALGDLSNGRIGHGLHEYDVPLADGSYIGGALVAENLASRSHDKGPAVHVKDASKAGVLVIRMPSSYPYLTGRIVLKTAIADGGKVKVAYSENNGLDWANLGTFVKSGEQEIDLTPRIARRYDYQVRFTLSGAGTGLDALKIAHDILQSQRALPALAAGDNTIRFSAAPSEGTLTITGNTDPTCTKQIRVMDFHPELKHIEPNLLRINGAGSATFRIQVPGELTRLRFGGHYRARDKKDGWDYQVSFDDGKTFETVGRAAGPTAATCKYVTVDKVPPKATRALVRFSGKAVSITCMFRMRIDADYKEPQGGFRPIKVTYRWDENGQAMEDVHIAKSADETYKITCGPKPTMKSITMEWAE